MKEFRVFFSWQSDLPSNQTKGFIEECIEQAKESLSDTVDLIPDEATRERFGTPDIMNSIFEKIDECDLFIADVSVVGKYESIKQPEDEEKQYKFLPNPNVLLELGYAAACKSWERCICFINTKYGERNILPFDIRNRRVTAFSYSDGGRAKEKNRITEIIISTVKEYLDKPIPKKDFSAHIIGGYDFESNSIEPYIVPYNKFLKSKYNEKTNCIINDAKLIIEKISSINLPASSKLEDDNEIIQEGLALGEMIKRPELAKKISSQLMDLHPATIDRPLFEEQIKKHLDTELCDDFFNLGGLKKNLITIPHSSSLEGTEQEKRKFNLFNDLLIKLFILDLRDIFIHMFDNTVIVPLAIKNISTKSDERITIRIKVVKGTPVKPTKKFFDQNYSGLEGSVYDEHLIEELLKLPENGDIKYDTSYSREAYTPSIPKFHVPHIDPFGYSCEPESNAEDYEQELQEYVQETSEYACNEYSFTIGALRPSETVWLDRVMLIQPVDGCIDIEYTIKSNNSSGELSGNLKFCEE